MVSWRRQIGATIINRRLAPIICRIQLYAQYAGYRNLVYTRCVVGYGTLDTAVHSN